MKTVLLSLKAQRKTCFTGSVLLALTGASQNGRLSRAFTKASDSACAASKAERRCRLTAACASDNLLSASAIFAGKPFCSSRNASLRSVFCFLSSSASLLRRPRLFSVGRGAVALSRQRFTLGPFFRISWRWITLGVVESLVVGVLVALCTIEGERRLLEEFSGRVRRCIRLA